MGKKNKKNPAGNLNKKTLTNSILGIISNHPRKTYNYKQLARQLLITDSHEKRLITEILHELKNKDTLEEISTGKFKPKPSGGYILGKVQIANGGYGFVTSESVKQDIFISQNNLNHALGGDTVKVYLYAHKKAKGLEGEVIEILERARETFVGVIELYDRYAFLTADSKQMPFDLFIPLDKLNGAVHGQKVIGRITEWPRQAKNPFGEVIEILGIQGDNEAEMHAILSEFGLPYKFSETVEEEASRIPDKITPKDFTARRDFRGIVTFTIDPEDAKDFDDALSIRHLPDGNWEIGVHIADVTHYVKPGTILDQEAQVRATSVYLVDRVVPMLPEKLSNFVCSLRPGEEKLCFSAVFEMDDNARVLTEWFGRTLIKSDHRFSYSDAQKIIDSGEGDLKDEMLKLNELALLLKKRRFDHGSISFERDEVKIDVDEQGKPVRVYHREHGASHELIEEFMLLANRCVATYIGNVKEKKERKTFVYRIHDRPDEEKLRKFSHFVKKFGYQLTLSSGKKTAESINRLLTDVKGTSEQDIVENLALRAMAKAEYSTVNIGHYGLAFDFYTHFTSPIRRYPDMMVHRLLGEYLKVDASKNQKEYEKLCRHSTKMEILAMEAERASIKYKQVEFLQDKIGLRFDGIISGVTEWGIYVEIIENKCEGMVSMRGLKGDFYEYDENNYCIRGRRTGKKYQIGDPVRIEVVRTNLVRKQVDFALIDNEE